MQLVLLLQRVIFQVLDPQYGMYVWPCAVVLAQYVWFHRRLVCDKRILEVKGLPYVSLKVSRVLKKLEIANGHLIHLPFLELKMH